MTRSKPKIKKNLRLQQRQLWFTLLNDHIYYENKSWNCFLYVSDPPYHAFIVTLLHQDTSADHPRINTQNKSKWSIAALIIAWHLFLRPAYVKDILSYAEAKTIMKRLFSYQNKEKTKQLLKTFGYATSAYKFWNVDVFPLLLCYRHNTAFLIGISWITFACVPSS